jgi:SPP1 family predicted phage head-tail adaptor
MKPLNAGDLRHPIVIQQRTDTKDAFGAPVPAWTTVFATPWAKIEPLSGRELELMRTMGGTETHKITIRYLQGVIANGTLRVSYTQGNTTTARIFTISSVSDIEERNYMMVLMCTEDVRL